MIKFERYAHVNDLINHYLPLIGDQSDKEIVESGITDEDQARKFTTFIFDMVDAIHDDAEKGVLVLGSEDNTDTIPDISYEVTGYMKKCGYFAVWDTLFEK